MSWAKLFLFHAVTAHLNLDIHLAGIANHSLHYYTHVQNVTCTFIRFFFVWAVLCPPTPPDTMLKANMVRITSSTQDPADRTPQHCIRGGALNARSRKARPAKCKLHSARGCSTRFDQGVDHRWLCCFHSSLCCCTALR